jgi:Holliday junction resolvase
MSSANMKTATISKPKKKPVDSRAKGARGERELAHFLQSHGFAARRGLQNCGGSDSPDVKHDIPGIHIECKRTETISLYPAMAQAIRDAGKALTPTVWHRRNGNEWLVILRAEDFLRLLGPEDWRAL